jgi:hypothetical protein
MPLPVIYTPVSKFMIPWDGTATGYCGPHYLDYMRCASRVGMVRAKYDCHKELADFHECTSTNKQLQRTLIMEKERKKQKRPPIESLGKDVAGKGY